MCVLPEHPLHVYYSVFVSDGSRSVDVRDSSSENDNANCQFHAQKLDLIIGMITRLIKRTALIFFIL